MRAGTEATSNLRPVTAPVDPLLTIATLMPRGRCLQPKVSKRARRLRHSSHSS